MYVWEDSKHQNWDGERKIILLIQSLPKKIIVLMATKSVVAQNIKFSEPPCKKFILKEQNESIILGSKMSNLHNEPQYMSMSPDKISDFSRSNCFYSYSYSFILQ